MGAESDSRRALWRSFVRTAGRVSRTVAHLQPAQVAFTPLDVARSLIFENVPKLSASLLAPQAAVWTHALLVLGDHRLPLSLVGLEAELARAHRTLDGMLTTPPVARSELLEWATLDAGRALAIESRTEGFSGDLDNLLAHLKAVLALPASSDVWAPQVVAARIFNLCVIRDLARIDDEQLALEVARHARWLAASLELQSPSTRLGEQGAALFVASCLVDSAGAAAWRTLGAMVVSRSARSDVFLDGGHVTRSSTLAAQYLQRLLFVLAAARSAGAAPPEGVASAADRLARHLLALSHPNGQPMRWRDSRDDGAPWPVDLAGALGLTSNTLHAALLGRVAAVAPSMATTSTRFLDAGALVIDDAGSVFAIFAADAGAGDAARHAQADVGSFEFSQDGVVLVSEPGVGAFEACAMRDEVRSAGSHSSVSVNGEGLDELWGGFLVGARGRVEPLVHQTVGVGHVIRMTAQAAAGWRHERLVVLWPGEVLGVFDRVVDAPENAAVCSHLHLAPEVSVLSESASALLGVKSRVWDFERLLGGALSVGASGTSRRNGSFEPSPALSIAMERRGQASFAGWSLALSKDARVHSGDGRAYDFAGRVRVIVEARGMRWERIG